MKVLFGPLHLEVDNLSFMKRALLPYDVQFFNAKNTSPYTVSQIFNNLPPGWLPDIMLFWTPECYSLPFEIETCPCPIVGVVTDATFNFQGLLASCNWIDFILSDIKTVGSLKQWGYEQALPIMTMGYDPLLHRKITGMPKIYDIVFLGNLNHSIHQERAKWLKRLAGLSQKYKIYIANNTYGEDYVKIFNRSKIVFNHTVQGTMNLRTVEAPACGSLLFIEDSNVEVRIFFQDKVHCVLYNEDNFETLLEYYLSHEQERENIALNGYDKVQSFTWNNVIKELFLKITQLNFDNFNYKNRRFYQLSPEEQHAAKITQVAWTNSQNGGREEILEREIKLCSDLKTSRLFNDFGVLTGNPELLKSAARDNAYPIAIYNLAQLSRLGNKNEEAEKYFLTVHEFLKSSQNYLFDRSLLQGLILPMEHSSFHKKWERIYQDKAGDPAFLARLLLWQTSEILGELSMRRNDYTKAESYFQQAIETSVTDGYPYYCIAAIAQKTGNFKKAAIYYEEAIKKEPFHFESWKKLAALLSCGGVFSVETISKIEEMCNILNAFPLSYNDIKLALSETIQAYSKSFVESLKIR